MNAPIVVGIDGSRTACPALGWAADDAARRGLPLRIVHVREPWKAEHALSTSTDEECTTVRCDRMLAGAAERARALAPETPISTALVTGAVLERLKDESERAETLVVAAPGPVALGLAGHTSCPLVVVRTFVRGGGGEVVAGYDGSSCADLALEYALTQASARHATLRVLHGDRYPIMTPHPVGYGPLPVDETPELRLRLDAWRERHPGARLAESVVRDHPVSALARASRAAELVVVGSRGIGGLTGLVLGSVSHGVLHRAHCPVAVIGMTSACIH
ncbi:universal stress protein [[Actinomadura] parvosata]|uniref:universal stress protein n=1 Tax=[Actinomadura] parvosata TaxID=1955412 RepID=UPI00406CB0C6